MNYIPLRVKTSYSLLTSLNDIKKMISFCKNNNINAIAITDNNMYGVMEFYKECLKSNIKPIIGLELIIDDGGSAKWNMRSRQRMEGCFAEGKAVALSFCSYME